MFKCKFGTTTYRFSFTRSFSFDEKCVSKRKQTIEFEWENFRGDSSHHSNYRFFPKTAKWIAWKVRGTHSSGINFSRFIIIIFGYLFFALFRTFFGRLGAYGRTTKPRWMGKQRIRRLIKQRAFKSPVRLQTHSSTPFAFLLVSRWHAQSTLYKHKLDSGARVNFIPSTNVQYRIEGNFTVGVRSNSYFQWNELCASIFIFVWHTACIIPAKPGDPFPKKYCGLNTFIYFIHNNAYVWMSAQLWLWFQLLNDENTGNIELPPAAGRPTERIHRWRKKIPMATTRTIIIVIDSIITTIIKRREREREVDWSTLCAYSD